VFCQDRSRVPVVEHSDRSKAPRAATASWPHRRVSRHRPGPVSVPYIANLENGRGNPTVNALSRLAVALGTELSIEFTPSDDTKGHTTGAPAAPPSPALMRLGRGTRFRAAVTALAARSSRDPHEVETELFRALSLLEATVCREASEQDWWRVLDALILVAEHPA